MRIVVVLPAPFAPRNPQMLAGRHRERHAVERLDRAEPFRQADR